MNKLKYVDFLNLPKLRIIGTNAFANVANLGLVESIGNDDSVLIYIKANAFNNAFSAITRASTLNIIHIPSSIITLGATAFAYQNWTNAPLTIGL
jgi:hypothetical protein